MEIQEVGEVHWALDHLVLERSDIMAGLNIYSKYLNQELVAACQAFEVVVEALLVLP